MKKPMYTVLSTLLSITLIAMVGCGENSKQAAGGKNKKKKKKDSSICDRVRPNGRHWKDPKTGTKYRRHGNYLEEQNKSHSRINCSKRFDGKNGKCENTYYDDGRFYSHNNHYVVDDCDIRDYYFVRQGNTCPYGYSPYLDTYYDSRGRVHSEYFCLNSYIFYNWGYTGGHQWNYHYYGNGGSFPEWLAGGLLIGIGLGLAL